MENFARKSSRLSEEQFPDGVQHPLRREDQILYNNLADDIQHGFVLRNGNYISIVVPGALATEANGIDPQDDVVGRYYTADRHTHAYSLAKVQ